MCKFIRRIYGVKLRIITTCHVFDDVIEDRAAGWYRMPAVLAVLGRNEYGWVFYMDLDAVKSSRSARGETALTNTNI